MLIHEIAKIEPNISIITTSGVELIGSISINETYFSESNSAELAVILAHQIDHSNVIKPIMHKHARTGMAEFSSYQTFNTKEQFVNVEISATTSARLVANELYSNGYRGDQVDYAMSLTPQMTRQIYEERWNSSMREPNLYKPTGGAKCELSN